MNTPVLHRFRAIVGVAGVTRLYAVLLLPALVMAGCYGFTNDSEPPEWTPDPRDAVQDAGSGLATKGGPGAVVFNQKCAVCHQMTGKGIPGVYPTLEGSAFATGDPKISVRIVLHGFQGPIVRNGQSINGVMQPWQNELDDQQVADVLTYIRSSWGNTAPAVDAATVKQIREETKNKAGAFTEAELKSLK